MKEVFDRYSARTPEPLTAQFSGRVDKETAVKKETKRTKRNKDKESALNFSQQVCYISIID